ncbi:alpha/beta fold hydrolase [Candidatus Nitrosotenuis sp. DW1]|uniref:alpha/beta fold hydrolase n=1 Tax=Candidatus Nitrosotenuis sp. DW1 TaxID=2259672 RepID=UPI0015C798B1|nr:alpha/beta hydrolase [Candidatus Nitrosotenuis sp. DW1]QLH09070.1 alpha/beta hydrolase [Candidatus Nitrosotenuis sp. DW1]
MREEFVNIDGSKIRYITTGSSKKNLVLIHGLGASAERWAPILSYFGKHYNVVVPDLIGFGYSDKPNTDYTADFFAKFVSSFVDTLGLDRTMIMGSSLGGQIAIEYTAANQQTVDKLILVSPAGAMKQSTPALDAYIMAALYPDQNTAKNAFTMMTGNNKDVNQGIVDDFVQRMRLPNAKFAFMSTLLGLKNAPEITTRLEKIMVPTLVVWGELDPVIPVKYAEKFVREIRDCRFYQMENCGHTPYVEDPENFANLVLDFMKTNK